jgi:MSHA biogenesis protein MshK
VLFSANAIAEELPDPTRPPVSIAAPVAASGVAAASAPAPAGLQSIIISKTRRAAIIDGETVELGGKHGDAKLIEVNEGGVVLRSAQGRQVLTLFPDVKITGKRKTGMKPQHPAGEAQPGKRNSKPVAREEKK